MAKTDEQLAQEQLADRGVDYKYGGDSVFGAFMPERRRILRPEQEQFVGYDSSGNAIIQNIPAEYGPSEYDPSFSPVVRGARSAGSFLRDIFLGDANEQSAAFGRAASALRGIGEGIADYAGGQARSALAGGVSFNQDTGQVDTFDPLVFMGGAGAGQTAARQTARSALNTTPARMNRARQQGFDTETPLYHYTAKLENGGEFTEFQPSYRGKMGKGIYLSADPQYGLRYVLDRDAYREGRLSGEMQRLPTDEQPMREGARAIPVYVRGNIAGPEAYERAYRQAKSEWMSQNPAANFADDDAVKIRMQDILKDEGYTGASAFKNEVVVFDPQDLRSINAEFQPGESAQILYSGGGRTGTGVAAGSALRESFRIGDEGFDARFDDRALEQDRIQNTELQYEVRPFERPEVSIYDLEGKPFRLTMSDRTAAGRDLTGVEGVEYDIPINLQGGQDFMFANPLGREGQVWAQDKGATSKYLNSFLGLDGQPMGDEFLMLPFRMSPAGGDFATMTGEVMVTHARNNVPARAKRQADEKIRQFYPTWKGIDNPESLQQISEMKGDPRKALLNVMDKDLRNEGGLGIGQARLAVSDRSQYNALDTGLQNVGIATPNIVSVNRRGRPILERFEDSGHRTYEQGLAGRPMGTLIEQDISAYELLPDYLVGRGFRNFEDLMASDPSVLATEAFTLRRGTRGGTITEDMLRDIERRRSQ